MVIKKITQKLIEDFDGADQRFAQSIQIFRRSPYGYRIMLEIMAGYYGLCEEKVTLEYLSKKVLHLASRITVSNFLKTLKSKKLIEIQPDDFDHRLKIIAPSEILLKDYNNWLSILFSNAE